MIADLKVRISVDETGEFPPFKAKVVAEGVDSEGRVWSGSSTSSGSDATSAIDLLFRQSRTHEVLKTNAMMCFSEFLELEQEGSEDVTYLPVDVLESMSRDEIRDYVKDNYLGVKVPNNQKIPVIVANIKEAEALQGMESCVE